MFSQTNNSLASENTVSDLPTKVDETFSFKLTNSTVKSILDYTDKPILLEWGASWCPVCSQNREEIGKIYDDYKDVINFLSVSYGGSGDTLADVQHYKFKSPWDFGLDTENYAGTIGVSTGDLHFINTDLTIQNNYVYKYLAIDIVKNEFIQDLHNLVTSDPTYDPELVQLPNTVTSDQGSQSNTDPETPETPTTSPGFDFITGSTIFVFLGFALIIKRNKSKKY